MQELDRNRGRECVLVAAAVGPAARETERRADALPRPQRIVGDKLVQLATQPVLTQVVQQRLAGAAAVGGQRGLDKLGASRCRGRRHASRGRSTRVIALGASTAATSSSITAHASSGPPSASARPSGAADRAAITPR